MTLADVEAWGTCDHAEAAAPATEGEGAGTPNTEKGEASRTQRRA